MKMAMNINYSSDEYYRYKMPALGVTYKRATTIIENALNIAKALKRPITHLEKWFVVELSTSASSDGKSIVLKGVHDCDRLRALLKKFIETVIVCSRCDNPETVLEVISREKVSQTCLACGHSRNIYAGKHKLIKEICTAAPKRTKKPKRTIQKLMGEKKDEEEEDDDWCCDTSSDAVKQRAREFFGEEPRRVKKHLEVVVDEDDDFIVFEEIVRQPPIAVKDKEFDDFVDTI